MSQSVPAPNLTVAAHDFAGALALLRAGRPVRRDSWPAHAPSYLYLSTVGGEPHISAMRGAQRLTVWVPALGDLLATDWRAASASECR